MIRRIETLLQILEPIECIGDLSVGVEHITHDSRECFPGTLFAAVPGELFDGHDFISQVIGSGAVCIVHERILEHYQEGICYIRVHSSRRALSKISMWFHGTADLDLKIIGVTGTDGKSSTCFFLYQLLKGLSVPCSILSTVFYDTGKGREKNPTRMTTPEAPVVHRFLAQSAANGIRVAIIEASSHALSDRTHRLADITFDAAVTTTISSEHLDFHGSLEAYIADKLSIYSRLSKNGGIAVAQADSPHLEAISEHAPHPPLTYALSPVPGDISFKYDHGTIRIMSDRYDLDTVIPAPFSQPFLLLDLAASVITVWELLPDTDRARTLELLPGIQHLDGRCSEYPFDSRLAVIDYAHTADSFRRLFSFYRAARPDAGFIIVFGSAGRRDKSKRAEMGRIAAQFARRVIITNEDPRNEDPASIYEDIISDLADEERYRTERLDDRKQAIEQAFRISKARDILFFLGKGHESSIESGGKQVYWNEEAIVESMIERRDLWKP